MKVSIYTNGKEHKRDIPISWDQVNFKDFLALEYCGDDIVKVIALLTRMDYEVLLKSKIANMDQVIAILGFLKQPPKPYVPNKLLIYDIPKDLAFEQVQMYVDLKNYINASHESTPQDKLKSYTLYCAVYSCIQKHGKYDWKLAEAMADEFLQAPCTEVMGVGNFTLVKLIGLNLNINPDSLKANTLVKKFKLVLKSWRKTSVHLERWFSWRKRLGIKKMNY